MLRTLSGRSSHVCSNSRCTPRAKLRTAITNRKSEPDDTDVVFVAVDGARSVPDRLGAASGQGVAIDERIAPCPRPGLRQHRARQDRQRDQGGERAGGQRHRPVEARDDLKTVQDAEHERRPQPERQRPHDPLAVDRPRRQLAALAGVSDIALREPVARSLPFRARNRSLGDCVAQLLVVTGRLVCVADGKLSQRLVESPALADVGGDRDRRRRCGRGRGRGPCRTRSRTRRGAGATSSPLGITFMSRNCRT